MKVAALILGLIGALITTGLGAKWVTDYNKNRASIESLAQASGALGEAGKQAVAQLERTHRAAYAMVVLGLAAIAASALVFKKSKVSGAVMLAAALVPAVLAPTTLIFTFFLVLGGLFALIAKPRAPAAPAATAAAS